ncbi:MAG TPA: FAD-binding protein [Nocardioidaceae bacterium]|nr:FAD-binding protein [Nocardioidaceae bacterium]
MTQPSWDAEADVVVVGFGAAGACAAIEAADGGADVMVLDRFMGGGATAISGGIVYAGGGTSHQRAAGVEDTPEQMLAYLRHETAGAVSEETLRSFCEGSVDLLDWLESHGVPFEGSLAPYKTSYPTNKYYLYYSGNELSGPARSVAAPAQRGHRAKGKGTSGRAIFGPLRRAVEQRDIAVQPLTRAEELVTDEAGVVIGVICSTVQGAPTSVLRQYRWMAGRVGKLNLWYRPAGKALSRRLERIERKYGRRWAVRARRGVVLSAGGFAFNREMVREHAAPYAQGLPLGTLGDDGSGIRLGRSAGGTTKYMDRASAWRFYTPPSALAKGVLLGPTGARVCNEALYGAAVAEAVIHEHGGQAHLLVDRKILDEARKQVPAQTLWFQRLQTLTMFGSGRSEGPTVAEVAKKVGIDADTAERTVAAYNDVVRSGAEDPMGKPADQMQQLGTPPYSLIDVSVRSSVSFPCPTMTLGGLVVDERTGQVLREDGSAVPHLYAAGRTAAGICSNSYVSGLSIADCVYSGRRAGRSLAKSVQEESADAVR